MACLVLDRLRISLAILDGMNLTGRTCNKNCLTVPAVLIFKIQRITWHVDVRRLQDAIVLCVVAEYPRITWTGHPVPASLFTGDGDSISAFQGLFLIGSNVVPSDVDNPSLYTVTWLWIDCNSHGRYVWVSLIKKTKKHLLVFVIGGDTSHLSFILNALHITCYHRLQKQSMF